MNEHNHDVNAEEFDWNDMYQGDARDYEPPDPLLLEVIDTLEAGRALDVGCGAGGLLAALAERGWQVTGVDVAHKGIAAARSVLAERGHAAELHIGDATTWEPEGVFDLITSSFALPGQPADRARVFAMMRRALAPGGTVLIKEFDPSMSKPELFESYDLPTPDELAAAFAGLEIARAEVVVTPVHHHADQAAHGDETWTASFLHARRPTTPSDG